MSVASSYSFPRIEPQASGRVAVLLGGRAAERAVSIDSGTAVLNALQAAGVDAFGLDLFGAESSGNLVEQLQAQPMDVAFNMLHGGEGENGTVSAVLEALGVPYTGSNMIASALALDKLACKYLWQGMGLATAPFRLLHADDDWGQVAAQLGLPLMVKPVREGSSIGMSKVEHSDQLGTAYTEAARYDRGVMAEAWLGGEEYTVAILAGKALPAIRLRTRRGFYDYQAKYVDSDTEYLIPCGLPEAREHAMQQFALQAFASLGCSGWGRVDLMHDSKGELNLLEVNTVPGMTSHSLVPMAAKAAGLTFNELVLQILNSIPRSD